MGRVVLGSFKVKLVLYFLLLSVLPMVAAFWGFANVAGQSETRRVDARLQEGLRTALASYQEQIDAAQRSATDLTRRPSFQRALESRNPVALDRIVEPMNNVSVEAGRLHSGET